MYRGLEYMGGIFCLLAVGWGIFFWWRLRVDSEQLRTEKEAIERLLDECSLVKSDLEQLLKELSYLADEAVSRLEKKHQDSQSASGAVLNEISNFLSPSPFSSTGSVALSSVPPFYQEVVNLLNEGKTRCEIAEALGIGQGEVELVLNLYVYNNNKRSANRLI